MVGRTHYNLSNAVYLHFSNHLGHQLPENKCQNWCPFGGYWRAAQPVLMRRAKELAVSTRTKPTVIVADTTEILETPHWGRKALSVLSTIRLRATWIHTNLLKR